MARPSMFSSDYEQQMKRRRLNIILVILIILFGGFFGVQYYLKKNNIVLFPRKPVENKVSQNKSSDSNVSQKKQTPPKTNQASTPEKPKQLSYEYTRKDGKKYIIQYTDNGGKKEITGLVDNSKNAEFDISKDKQSIVFDDNSGQRIILATVDGQFKVLSRDTYKSKSNKTYTEERVLKNNSWFVWAEKPHFTSGGNIVYVSHLPYIKKGGFIYLWVMKADGTSQRKIGKLSKDIANIVYGNFDEKGRLIINVSGTAYYISPNGYSLTK